MPQACYAIQNPVYQPAMRIVTSVTQGYITTITTSFKHQYANGIIVRFDFPIENGMQELSGPSYPKPTYPITVTGLTTFTVPVDSRAFTPYVDTSCACVTPVGELNSQFTNATVNALPYSAS